MIVFTLINFRNSSSFVIFSSYFIFPYDSASIYVTCKNDSICAKLVTSVELYLASASLITTGALICA